MFPHLPCWISPWVGERESPQADVWSKVETVGMIPAFQLRKSIAIPVASAVTVLIGLVLSETSPVETARARIYDLFLQRPHQASAGPVAIVDIDRATLEQIGAWPWSRERLAGLVDAIATARPKAIGIDFLLVGTDERSPGALARNLAALTSDQRVASLATSLADSLPDGDKIFADAIRKAPTVLGMVLDADIKTKAPRPAPILVRGRPDLKGLWHDDAAVGPIPLISEGAKGHGVLLLPGDPDASIRRVPLLVATGTGLQPGLALEVARVGAAASSYLLGGAPLMLRTGSVQLRMPPDGMLRLRPVAAAHHQARLVSAVRILREAGPRAELAGRIVLVGSSAPELGGLRPSASGLLVPSVQIQADAVEQILRADVPHPPRNARWLEALAALLFGAAAITAAMQIAPLRAGTTAAALGLAWLALSYAAARGPGLLIDPLLVPAVTLAAFAAAALMAATLTRRREALIRRRFEQHLAPAVVQRIVEQPSLLKLKGESRVVTAFFTDIEGFTAMTERAEPTELVALLDRYIDGTSRIVLEHGGMVEKVVGDALHAIFNAPLDLPDHPRHALACAQALTEFTERLRQEPDARRLALGRTRIGIETGRVIVGDVGGLGHLDYTAHGNAMNRAARLEAANKELGSTICIGSGAAAHLDADLLRPLGDLTLRGVSDALRASEPWPAAMSHAARVRYRAAMLAIETDPAAAAAAFAALALEYPTDRVLETLSLRAHAKTRE